MKRIKKSGFSILDSVVDPKEGVKEIAIRFAQENRELAMKTMQQFLDIGYKLVYVQEPEWRVCRYRTIYLSAP